MRLFGSVCLGVALASFYQYADTLYRGHEPSVQVLALAIAYPWLLAVAALCLTASAIDGQAQDGGQRHRREG